jgi:fumarate hydratase class II
MEKDTLGEVRVPAEAYYGAQTQRAVENFPVSGLRLQPEFVRAQAIVKRAAAKANVETGGLDPEVGGAIVAAAEEVMQGGHDGEFVVDVFQAGAGTSQNMNVNEVLANRASEILGGGRGEYTRVHPNDHVNMAQSTNDTIHTAIHISALIESEDRLLPALEELEQALAAKAGELDHVIKCGRTHMQDAVPIRLGQELGAYASMMRLSRGRVEQALEGMRELSVGGSAVGTGLNVPLGYRERVVRHINDATGRDFRIAGDMFEAMQSLDAVVALSGSLRTLSTGLLKISKDLILMSSGPRTGLAEIHLPALQPGSSIMPGKVNPVLAEMLGMVCYQAMGCDTTIVLASQAGQLELNVMMPVIAYNLLLLLGVLFGGMRAFTSRCVHGIQADEETCLRYAESSPSLATALSPAIGYHDAARLAVEALEQGKSVRELAAEKRLLDGETLRRLLDLRQMTESPDDRSVGD